MFGLGRRVSQGLPCKAWCAVCLVPHNLRCTHGPSLANAVTCWNSAPCAVREPVHAVPVAPLCSSVLAPFTVCFCALPPLPSWLQRGYGVLCVSQFTLFGRLKGAGKPDFSKAMPPQQVRWQGTSCERRPGELVLHCTRGGAAVPVLVRRAALRQKLGRSKEDEDIQKNEEGKTERNALTLPHSTRPAGAGGVCGLPGQAAAALRARPHPRRRVWGHDAGAHVVVVPLAPAVEAHPNTSAWRACCMVCLALLAHGISQGPHTCSCNRDACSCKRGACTPNCARRCPW